ncbi:MAG: acyl carrier protein phosphodiesterase [Flavobacteriales bacterium]|jgi:acyl carrier protein phosphodiesterase
MNYLAHIFLSGEDPDLLAGNFMGDFIKGSDYNNYPKGIANGMVFHRFIDSFTDQHAESALLREKLRPTCGRYAGIALDMIYDYYLAEGWSDYSKLKLDDFANDTYLCLENYYEIMPADCQFLYAEMRKTNWLVAYKSAEGMSKAMNGLNRRLGGESGLPATIPLLESPQLALREGFKRFFPELEKACLEKITSFARVDKDEKQI